MMKSKQKIKVIQFRNPIKKYTSQILLVITIAIIFLLMSFMGGENKPIELKLKYKIGEKHDYLVKTKRVGNKFFPGFGYKRLDETKVQFSLKSIDENENLILNLKHLYIKMSDSTYNKKWATFDTRVKTSNRLSFLKSLREEIDVNYRIVLNEQGEIIKKWTLENGVEADNGVLIMNSFQIIFPKKKVSIEEKWEYESNGVFAIHDKSKFTFWVKKYDKEEVHIGFESTLETEDINNGAKTHGEYILDKSSNILLYAKIQGGVDGNIDFLEIEKIK